MPKLPRVKPTKVISALQRASFYIDHVTGSHYILYKNDKSNPVSVPRHNKDIKAGTLHNILKRSGMSIKEFQKYL